MGPSNGDLSGTLKVELDSEILQDAEAQLKYIIRVENNSELDYVSKDYYHFGIENENDEKVKLQPEGVYDYLESQTFDEEKDSSNWKVVSREKYDEKFDPETNSTLMETYYNEWTKEQEENGSVVKRYGWERMEKYETLLEEWKEEITESRTIRDAKLNNKTILYNEDLEGELEPNESKEVELYAEKQLYNTDEINLNNDAEITQIRRTTDTGRTPGYSEIYDSAEEFIVTSPTGGNQNYIVPIAIIVTALLLLGIGVVVIKKKVLDE